MSEGRYPHGESLFPEAFDEHTIVFLVRPSDAPDFGAAELDRLQAEHLAYLRELARRGALVANGPLSEQTDSRYRGVSIYALPLAEALERARADPMVRAGRLAIDGGRWATQAGTARFGSD
ncbi:MAG TPA: YciI family protein [Candidatus Binatia bacterium]|nr:YciI family protein [Candidatus Binatia bacterium]